MNIACELCKSAYTNISGKSAQILKEMLAIVVNTWSAVEQIDCWCYGLDRSHLELLLNQVQWMLNTVIIINNINITYCYCFIVTHSVYNLFVLYQFPNILVSLSCSDKSIVQIIAVITYIRK